jgi:hypothetical protein
METETLPSTKTVASSFPLTEVKRRLLIQLQAIADQGSILRPEWEPLLDSKRVVGTILALEGLFSFRIPPDKVVRKGGYASVSEAMEDMLVRLRNIWDERNKQKVRR